jgi:hypothetical protein
MRTWTRVKPRNFEILTKNKIVTVNLGLSMGLILGSTVGWSHARFKVGSMVTPPRNDSTGLKTPPCGGVPRTASVRTFRPGQQITVEFEETIDHLGFFQVFFMSANDSTDGTPQPLMVIQDNQNTPVANGVNHQFTGQITLPNISCEGCTLQLIQVMQDQGPNGPSSFYYSCSDIRLSNNPAPPPTPPAPAPSPAPSSPTPPAPGGTPSSPGPQTAPTGQAPQGQKPEKPTGLKIEKTGGNKP